VKKGGRPVAVELLGVVKDFGSVRALDSLDLTIRQGEVVALLGPNGAGKTTAINIMVGLRRPTRGSARLFGLDPRDRRARTLSGVMLQDVSLPPNLKVTEMIRLFSACYPAPLPGAHLLEVSGLVSRSAALIGTLSTGERQRLFYALAICGDPCLLFLDEPSVGMDVEGRRSFWENIHRIAARGSTIVLTTHYLEEAEAIAERVVVLKQGRVIADGTPEVLKGKIPSRRLRFEFVEPPVNGLFEGLSIQSVRLDNSHATILTDDPEAVLERMFQRRYRVRDIEVVGASLEEAFVELTGLEEVSRV
jgi:ABC-2 type transport system ATP-binding protein